MAGLPEKFKASDIALHLPNGATATDGSKVTIDGKVSIAPGAANGPGACFVTVEWAAPCT